RLVEIEGIAMEAELGPHVLLVRNQDKPGFIGNLGRSLGDAGINIATFHLGRLGPEQGAVALIQVDQPLNDAVLDQVRALPHVVQVKGLKF
ncbi:MAG: D-3-phosphoglycerate dehydrogenase / 2-oxoglutarate reductase, partial [Aliidongia sp.]|nr:D-3-phosphoglycerate dehydrogenase / 2-oxoglutarate reductase [Aliidongia sp.]